MSRNKIIAIIFVVLLIASFATGFLVHRSIQKSRTVAVDTLVIYRQESITNPEPVSVEPAPKKAEPISINKEDIIETTDSSIVHVHPDTYTYADTLESGVAYNIEASGLGVELSNIGIYWPEKNINKYVPRRGWSVDLVGSGNLSGFRPENMSFGIGLEVGYSVGRFTFGFGPGVEWTRPPGATSFQPSLSVSGTVGVRLFEF